MEFSFLSVTYSILGMLALEHVVTITAKRFTKGLAQLPLLQQFNYTCGCRSTKTHCVHLSLVLMSDFSLADV